MDRSEESWFHGIGSRSFAVGEVLDRCVEANMDHGMRRFVPAIASLQGELMSKIPCQGRLMDKDSISTF